MNANEAATERVVSFFTAWSEDRLEDAADHLQRFRVETQAQEEVERMSFLQTLERFQVFSFAVYRTEQVSPVIVDVFGRLSLGSGGVEINASFKLRTVCEAAPYTPTPSGSWMVNLNSLSFQVAD